MARASFATVGSFVDGAAATWGETTFAFAGPSEGAPAFSIAEAGETGAAAAVAAARTAGRAHGRTSVFERVALLEAAAAALATAAETVATLICEDVGKPIRLARVEVRRCVDYLRGCAAVIATLPAESSPLDSVANGAGCIGLVRRVPYGVVGAITPFNAPANLLLQKVAPAIAAGNTIVVKPAPAGLRTALHLATLFVDAGWPPGLFNVVSGDRETAARLVVHPDVRAVSFTGGTAGGQALARLAGAKKFLSELGSNAANIVCADADLAAAATKIAAAGFEASGQQCISAQRVLVARDAFEPFLAAFLAAAGAMTVGPANDPATDIGPMVCEAAASRVMAMVQDALDRGATLLLAPRRTGAIVSPAVLGHVPRDARLWREEVFGPVVVVSAFESADEALALANESAFGLQGAVFTRDLATAFRFARDFDVGSLWINEASRFRLDMTPFGGVKDSGVGREGLRYAIEEMSQLKFIGIRT